MTKDQRDLLRRMTEREKEDLLCRADDVKALLSLICELGGAKDRAEFKLAHYSTRAFCEQCAPGTDPRHFWTPEQWIEEWKKREMGDDTGRVKR